MAERSACRFLILLIDKLIQRLAPTEAAFSGCFLFAFRTQFFHKIVN
ncbi:hypothetical protein ADIAL_1321 [Alkalibacterium sp. AK22]|nr:hypothetical protein ADIAL_1321 [Alkalibacterium sp. AK22]